MPSFYQIYENELFWGKGFTEWNNVKNGKQLFDKHNQPRIPHKDIGYYFNNDIRILRKQISLAKQHGIFGFCFYYYWFSNKKLLNSPIDLLFENKDIDFNYMICWANENWTKSWDGKKDNVLIEQKYKKDDANRIIKDLKKYFSDERYIKIDGKPAICVYNFEEIPNQINFIKKMREEAANDDIGDIYILTVDRGYLDREYFGYIDGIYEFPPFNEGDNYLYKDDSDNNYYDYCRYVETYNDRILPYGIDYYRGSMLEWDNSCRRKNNKSNLWVNYSSELFYKLNRKVINKTRKEHESDKRFIFINAWNEWGEGTYLEPDNKNGYANINALSKAIFDINYHEDKIGAILNQQCSFDKKILEKSLNNKKSPVICIQLHMYYVEMIFEFIEKLNNIRYPYDIYVTTTSEQNKAIILTTLRNYAKSHYIQVEVVKNKGRDVLPFINQISKVYNKYDYICHIHTKKSITNTIGDKWRNTLLNDLLGSDRIVDHILFNLISRKEIGLVIPKTISDLKESMTWGSNIEHGRTLEKILKIDMHLTDEKIVFPVGNMFWAKTSAIKDIFAIDFDKYVPSEDGQLDATILHAIERSWVYIANSNGYSFIESGLDEE